VREVPGVKEAIMRTLWRLFRAALVLAAALVAPAVAMMWLNADDDE
jgi:hypothetical protein